VDDPIHDRVGVNASQQHRDQAHKKDRPGIHQRPQLQNAYPVAQCRQNSGMNILTAEHSPRTVKSPTTASPAPRSSQAVSGGSAL
jgi:hypothetical protein